MSNVAKLKKQAAEFELKKQFDKALAVYVKLLASFDEHAAELDVALFNRVGDLMLRNGNVADAVDYYEQAVDRYADTGFFNNAIALCNKILRHSPGRTSVYYKLGKVSAQKGFKNDARVNFLEYADRMKSAGKDDEAFRALEEFADLCPDQVEIRHMLADQLIKAGRKNDAIEQLQILYERYESEDLTSDAQAVAERIRGLDAKVELRSGGARREISASDLVFLDLDAPPRAPTPLATPAIRRPPLKPPVRGTPAPAPTAPPSVPPSPAVADTPAAPSFATPIEGITRIGEDDGIDQMPSSSLSGLESTNVLDDSTTTHTPTGSLLDFDETTFDSTPIDRSSVPTHSAGTRPTPLGDRLDFTIPPVEPIAENPRATPDFAMDALTTPASSAPATSRPTPPERTSLDGLPLMDLEVPEPETPSPQTPPSVGQIFLEAELVEQIRGSASSEAPPIDGSARSTPVGVDADDDDDDDGESESQSEYVSGSTPVFAHPSTTVAAHSVSVLRESTERMPDDWGLRRQLAEAMLEAGDRDGGIRELETAMAGAERTGNLDLASSLAEEIARLEPDVVKHHQKRVEYAFRTNDRGRLIEAYLSLADALLRADQTDKARTVYQRVIDLSPDEARARIALDAVSGSGTTPAANVSGVQRPATGNVRSADKVAPRSADPSFVNLGDWLREEQSPKDTRMVVAEQEPTGDEEADFADMLRKFKQGIAENVDAEDYQSHYDLAVAFKEMGLIDEAIAEFQKALGSPTTRLPTYEALGQCFMEKGQFKLASSILSRALTERASEDQLLGVLYWLGRASEALLRHEDALGYYQRVFVLDIHFRDVADRMSELERAGR